MKTLKHLNDNNFMVHKELDEDYRALIKNVNDSLENLPSLREGRSKVTVQMVQTMTVTTSIEASVTNGKPQYTAKQSVDTKNTEFAIELV